MNKKTLAAALILLALSAASAAFSADAPKKVINYANGNAPPVLEPVMNQYLKTSYLMYNIFCGLARIGKNGIAELAYAESYDVGKDGVTYTFKIRKDSKFSDGSPLTAKDWEESFKYRLSPDVASPGINLYLYVKNAEAYNQGKAKAEDVGIKALDDATLQIVFENPTPFFMDLICYYIPYKMDLIKKNQEWFKKPETYIGNGAFRVKKLDPQVGFVLEKNPYYYDASNVKIDEVNYNFIDDDAVALEAYKKGDLDIDDSLNAEALRSFAGTQELKSFPTIGTFYFSVHTANVPDPRVRKAMSLAIDRGVLIKNILGKSDIPAEGIVPYGIHWGNKEFREVAGPLIETDIEKAKKLLEEAGHPEGKGLKPIRIITMNSQSDVDCAQALQSMFKQIGIQSEIASFEPAAYDYDLIGANNWDIAYDGWIGDYDDPKTNLFLWQAYRQGPDKDIRWYDTPNAKEFERLMKSADTLEKEQRLAVFRDAERTILDDMPVIPLWHSIDTILIKPEVMGIVKSNIGHVYFHYADVAAK
ncbi:MAG: peptide ABC transporter substrate-binding protein [Synergistaceae bacterium]|nr:peptide ABC transporter substrate-binding protein [Synergistaceae bacterium]